MVTYRCMLPAYRQYRYTGGAGNNTHHNTLNILSGRGPCIMFNTVLLLYLFCVFGIMYCATLTRVRARRLKKLSLFAQLFLQYNRRLLRQNTGGACLYIPKDG